MKIKILPDGKIQTIYADDNPFVGLGRKESIERVGDITFFPEDQSWYVTDPKTGDRIIDQGFPTYKDAVAAEVIYVEDNILGHDRETMV